MALTIETGAGIEGANSYVEASEFSDYAAAYGLSIPDTTDAQEVLLRRAAAAMDAYEWRGTRTHRSEQALAWPRLGIVVHGDVLASDAIPGQIKSGQMVLAAEIYADDQLPRDRGAVIREKVDVLETEYAEPRALSRPVVERPSLTHFGPYLLTRGPTMRVVRA